MYRVSEGANLRTAGSAVRKARTVLGMALFCCALGLVAAAAASAAPSWVGPVDLSQPGRNASNPAVAMDAAGNTVSIWERQNVLDGTSHVLQVSTREGGSGFTVPLDTSQRSTEPDLAMTPGGTAVAVWKHFENPPGRYVIQESVRPPGGSFSAPVAVWEAPPDVIPQELHVVINASGAAAVVWDRIDPTSFKLEEVKCENSKKEKVSCPNPLFVEASVRAPGGSFSPR